MADRRADQLTVADPISGTDIMYIEQAPSVGQGEPRKISLATLLAYFAGGASNFVDSPDSSVLHIERMTMAAYSALSPPDPDTLYVIVD